MKISIYLASFVLIKAMMPGALYAPSPNGGENCVDDVKTTAAAPATAGLSVATKEDVEALKQQNDQLQNQMDQMMTLMKNMQSASSGPHAPPLPKNGVSANPQRNPELLALLQSAFAEFEDGMSAADKLKTIKASKKKTQKKNVPDEKQLGVVRTSSVQSLSASNNEAKVLVKGFAEKFQDAEVKADALSAAPNPAGNKPALSPKPKVSADKPSAPVAKAEGPEVVTAKTVPSSKELGEVNGSAAIEAAPVAEVQITEAASESAEKPSVKDLRARFVQNAQDSVAKPTVQEKAQHSARTPVKTLLKNFQQS